MGIPTLIKTLTASGDSSLSFVDGTADVTLDSTYDEYMFVFTDINPATDQVEFTFQVNATDDAGGGYDTSPITSTHFWAYNHETSGATSLQYNSGHDQSQGTAFQKLSVGIGSDADQCCAGRLHLFTPSNTTYVKHFYATMNNAVSSDYAENEFIAGYINDTTAIDEIQFKMSSGNFDGVIQLYGIS
jgi:hypothetical protein